MRRSRKTYFRLKDNLQITVVAVTYHKAWMGVSLSVPSCSLVIDQILHHGDSKDTSNN